MKQILQPVAIRNANVGILFSSVCSLVFWYWDESCCRRSWRRLVAANRRAVYNVMAQTRVEIFLALNSNSKPDRLGKFSECGVL